MFWQNYSEHKVLNWRLGNTLFHSAC